MGAVGRGPHLVPGRLEGMRNHFAQEAIVFDYEKPRHRNNLSGARRNGQIVFIHIFV